MTEARKRSIGLEVDELVGDNIRTLRLIRGWTPQELSYQVRNKTGENISVAVIRTIEGSGSKSRRITIGETIVFARTFEVSLETMTKEMT